MKKSPAQIVKEKFGEKSKLVDAVKKLAGQDLWVARENEDKGLARVSNAKLLRLHDTFGAVQSKFGTRDKLIDALVEAEGCTKDASYRTRYAEWPVPRLYDRFKSVSKHASKKTAAVAPAKKTEKVEAAPAKKTATKKAASATAESKKPAAKKSAKKPA
jgi:hypothetical protein